MAVTTPCYATREEVKGALDFAETAAGNLRIDRAIQSASRLIDDEMHRRFYPEDRSVYKDWPNFDYAWPWRIWLDANELASDQNVTVTSGGVTLTNILVRHTVNSTEERTAPFNVIELDRSSSDAFGHGPTPQREIAIGGTFGYWLKWDPAGALTAAVTTTTSTTAAATDSSAVGVGDLILIDAERMLVTDRRMADTTVTFTGLTSPSAADKVLAVPDGTLFTPGEVLGFDAERCLVEDITGNSLILKRAWDGTVLAAHTSGTIWAARQLTVARGQLGTTAATHASAAPVSRFRYPALIKDLAIAESLNRVLQETSGYARTVGTPDMVMPASGAALADLWDEAETRYRRKARVRVI